MENCRKTLAACFTAYVVQAIVNNFVPLLFLTLQREYGVPLARITLLITFNFGVQFAMDLLSISFVDRLGYRASMLLAHMLSAAGLILLTFLPELTPDPYTGILAAVTVYAAGSGLLEVLVSPVVEACPTPPEIKERTMSLLHSFYCWGHAGVVLLSTLFFRLFGIGGWRIAALLWALLPAVNAVLFTRVPVYSPVRAESARRSVSSLFRNGRFWILLLMMVCAGAGEQAVSQWASAFAEKGLGVSKTLGDLAGPAAFALLMALSRTFYGRFGGHIDLSRFMAGSCALCTLAYLGIALSPSPVLSLVFCAVCGFSVGIFWPGTFSRASASVPGGGTALFALLALGGDIGCTAGPTLVGLVSAAAGEDLKRGILSAVLFPVLLLGGVLLLKRPPNGRNVPYR